MENIVRAVSLGELKRYFEFTAVRVIEEQLQASPLIVTCNGYIGKLASLFGSKYFEIPLKEHGQEILLDIPAELINEIKIVEEDYVSVTGRIIARIYKGQFTFRVDVSSICLVDTPEKYNKNRENKRFMDKLFESNLKRNLFPNKSRLKLTLIHSKSSQAQVDQDFMSALGEYNRYFTILREPVSMNDANAIARAIKKSCGDILVIIRGGGDSEQFLVFEDAVVIEALCQHKAYRVSGIGHSANTLLSDRVVDYPAATPSAAGHHIKELYREQRQLWLQTQKLEHKVKLWRGFAKSMFGIVLVGAFYFAWTHKSTTENVPTEQVIQAGIKAPVFLGSRLHKSIHVSRRSVKKDELDDDE